MARWNVSFFAIGALNAVILVAVLATRGVYESRALALHVELPVLTALALGPIVPALLGLLLLGTVISGYVLRHGRHKAVWEMIIVVLLGTIAGFYVIALWLPCAGRPAPLT